MAMNFEVSFEQTLRQLAATRAELMEVGQQFDKLEGKSARMASATAKGVQQVNQHFDRLEKAFNDTNVKSEALSVALDKARQSALRTFEQIAKGNVNATTKLSALNGELGEMGRLIRDTASKQAYTNWLQRTATLSAEAAGQTEFYRGKLAQLSTTEGIAAVQSAQLTRNRTKAIQSMASAASASANYRAIIQQLINAEREMAVTGQQVAYGYERLTTTTAAFTANQQRAKEAIDQANKAMVEGVRNIERYTGANAQAEQAARSLAQQERSAANARTSELSALRNAMQARAAQETAYQETVRQSSAATRTLSESEARVRAVRENQLAGTRAYNEAMVRNAEATRLASDSLTTYAGQLARVTSSVATGGPEKLNQQFAQMAARGREATSSLSALTKTQAQLQVAEERLVGSLQRRNDLTLAQARANATLSSSEARLTQRIQEQTAEYQRRAKYMQMTNAQLLGLSVSSNRVSRDMHINAQAAAMFRAGLGGLNASIGIYTSATVLAASATYAVASAFRTGMSAGMEFTETMARAEAIMMTSTHSLTSAGSSMEAVTMQVRALGASTLYTSTEVAGGLVDLGMAGLSASEAMTALSPALNLAAIGNIEMSRSADIATNVMTAFDKSASELGNVVDIMATAITNSNTNIEQLANALSYVGPAAQAAGFDLKDTTAAIELLSNAGIKASRAGTGLRRFMLNLQNPTAKGAEVLDRFGISVVNAEGQTRSMTDILGQFNRALHNDFITPAERTAALMDLFGVRAQSAVARMISSVGEFGVLRRQLDEVEGAAAKMRETMEDVLSMDWRQLKSAFQDIQLDVFLNYEEALRSFAAQARLTLMDLQTVNTEMTEMVFSPEQIAEGEFVSELDVLIAKVGEAIDVVKGLAIAFGTWKAASVATTMTSALAKNMWTFGERLETVNQRTKVYERYQRMANSRTVASGASLTMYQRASMGAAQGTNALTRELYLNSQAFSLVARAASVAMAAMGWAGVVYGVYTAVTTLFSNDTAERITNHNERVEQSRNRYKELQEQIKQTTEERQRLALVSRANELDTEAEALTERIRLTERAIEQFDEESTGYQRLSDDLYRYTQALADNKQQAVEAREAVSEVGVNQAQVEGMRERMARLAENIGRVTEQAEKYREEADKLAQSAESNIASPVAYQALIIAQQAAVESSEFLRGVLGTLRESYNELAGATRKAEIAASNHAEYMATTLNAQTLEITAEYDFSQLSDFEQMNQLAAERNVILASYIQLNATGIALSEEGTDKMLRSLEAALELNEEYLEAQQKVNETWDTVAEKQSKLEQLQLNEIETLETLEQKMRDVQAARIAMYALSFVSGEAIDPKEMEKMVDQMIELQGAWNQLNDRENKKSNRRTANHDYTAALETQRNLLAEMVQIRNEYKDAASSVDAEVVALQATNDLLYDNYETEAQRLALVDTLVNRQRASLVVYASMAERQEKIREQQEVINQLQAAAAGKTGKERKDAEEAVAKALGAQRDLVKEQVEDQVSLLEKAKERVIDAEGQVAELERQRHIVELARQYAAEGQAISLQESERLQGLKALNLEIFNQHDALEDVKAAAAGLSDQEMENNQAVQALLENQIDLLERRRDLETDPGNRADAFIAQYDEQNQKARELLEKERLIKEARDASNDDTQIDQYTRMLKGVREEMDELKLGADDFGERMENALRLIGDSWSDNDLDFAGKMRSGAAGTAALADGLRAVGAEGSAAFHALTIATDLQNLSAAIGVVVNQGFGDPYTAFGRMAAMAAAVASLGFNVGNIGGGGGMTSEEYSERAREQQTQGSVLGDAKSASKSIENAVDITAEATSELVGINRSMLEALQNVQAGISGAVTLIARDMTTPEMGGQGIHTNFTDQLTEWWGEIPLIGGIFSEWNDLLTKIPGINFVSDFLGGLLGGKAKHQDEGLIIDGGAIQDVINDTVVRSYVKWKEKKNAFSSYKNKEKTELVDDGVSRQFGLVFESIYDSVASGVESLGMLPNDIQTKLDSYFLETTRISLDDLDPEEQKQHINDVFSRTFDNMAEHVTPWLTEMQRAGEGLGETLARVSTQVQVGQEAVSRLGFGFSLDTQSLAEEFAGRLEEDLKSQLAMANAQIANEEHKWNVYNSAEPDDWGVYVDKNLGMRQASEELEFLRGHVENMNRALANVDVEAQQRAIRETAEAFEYLVEASGGLEDFVQGMNDALGNFATEAYQFQVLTSDITRALGQQNITLPQTRDGYWELIQAQDGATESGADNIATLLRLQETADGYYTKLEALEESYRDKFYSDAEKTSISVKEMAKGFADLGIQMPTTNSAFRALVEAQDETTEAGRSLRAGLLGLAEGFVDLRSAFTRIYESELGREPDVSGLTYWQDQVASGVMTFEDALWNISNSLESTRFKLETAYDEALGREPDTAGLTYWMNQVESGSLTLSEAIWHINNSAEAAEYAAGGAASSIRDLSEAIRTRETLETQLLQLQGNTDELRRRELSTLKAIDGAYEHDLVNLQLRVWAMQDEKAAQEELQRAQEQRIQNLERETRAMMSAGEGIRSYVESLQNTGKTNRSPEEQFRNAEDSFLAALTTIYQSDDDDLVRKTIENITGIADDYLSASQQWAGSGLEFQSAAALVEASMDDLATRLGAEEQDEIDHHLQAMLEIARNTGEQGPLAKQSALAGQLGELYASMSDMAAGVEGVLTYEQVVTAMAGQATNEELRAMFSALDLNNDGIITKLESVVVSGMPTDALLTSAITGSLSTLGTSQLTKQEVAEALSPIATDSEIARLITRLDLNSDGIITAQEAANSGIGGLVTGISSALNPMFSAIDTSINGVLDYSEFSSYFSGLATNAELETMFRSLDINNDGIITKLESVVIKDLPTDTLLASALQGSLSTLGSSQLTKEEVVEALSPIASDSEIARLITRLDLNSDGIITAEELTASKFDGLASGISTAIKPLFDTLDTTLDGQIDWTEFATAFDGLGTDDELKAAFKGIDTDMDGFITKAEAIATNTGFSGPLAKQELFNQKLETMFGGEGGQNYLYRQLGALGKIETAINNLKLNVSVDGQKVTTGGGTGGSNVDTTPSVPTGKTITTLQAISSLRDTGNSQLQNLFRYSANQATWLGNLEHNVGGILAGEKRSLADTVTYSLVANALGFSESRYLQLNPDVASAVAKGDEFKSGLQHFIMNGLREGRKFAKGGVFTNSVVDTPTYFNMAQMGEAGPEAIMPLTRGPGGALGVKSYGGEAVPDFSLLGQSDIGEVLRDIRNENRKLRADINKLMEENNRHAAAAVSVAAAGHKRQIDASERSAGSLAAMESKARLDAMS